MFANRMEFTLSLN